LFGAVKRNSFCRVALMRFLIWWSLSPCLPVFSLETLESLGLQTKGETRGSRLAGLQKFSEGLVDKALHGTGSDVAGAITTIKSFLFEEIWGFAPEAASDSSTADLTAAMNAAGGVYGEYLDFADWEETALLNHQTNISSQHYHQCFEKKTNHTQIGSGSESFVYVDTDLYAHFTAGWKKKSISNAGIDQAEAQTAIINWAAENTGKEFVGKMTAGNPWTVQLKYKDEGGYNSQEDLNVRVHLAGPSEKLFARVKTVQEFASFEYSGARRELNDDLLDMGLDSTKALDFLPKSRKLVEKKYRAMIRCHEAKAAAKWQSDPTSNAHHGYCGEYAVYRKQSQYLHPPAGTTSTWNQTYSAESTIQHQFGMDAIIDWTDVDHNSGGNQVKIYLHTFPQCARADQTYIHKGKMPQTEMHGKNFACYDFSNAADATHSYAKDKNWRNTQVSAQDALPQKFVFTDGMTPLTCNSVTWETSATGNKPTSAEEAQLGPYPWLYPNATTRTVCRKLFSQWKASAHGEMYQPFIQGCSYQENYWNKVSNDENDTHYLDVNHIQATDFKDRRDMETCLEEVKSWFDPMWEWYALCRRGQLIGQGQACKIEQQTWEFETCHHLNLQKQWCIAVDDCYEQANLNCEAQVASYTDIYEGTGSSSDYITRADQATVTINSISHTQGLRDFWKALYVTTQRIVCLLDLIHESANSTDTSKGTVVTEARTSANLTAEVTYCTSETSSPLSKTYLRDNKYYSTWQTTTTLGRQGYNPSFVTTDGALHINGSIWDVTVPVVNCDSGATNWAHSTEWLQECAWMPWKTQYDNTAWKWAEFQTKIAAATKRDTDAAGARYHWPIPCSEAFGYVFYALNYTASETPTKCQEMTTYNGTTHMACKGFTDGTGATTIQQYYQNDDFSCKQHSLSGSHEHLGSVGCAGISDGKILKQNNTFENHELNIATSDPTFYVNKACPNSADNSCLASCGTSGNVLCQDFTQSSCIFQCVSLS